MNALSLIYGFIINFRNFLYDKNIFRIKKIEGIKVICIGNITVGGTGKTPAVQYFVKKYQEQGYKVGVLSRGYGGKRKKDPLLVSDGENIKVSYKESGDESYLHALNLKAPVIVSKNRYLGLKFAKENFDLDIVVLDDGFQHRQLFRDKNIILIDASNPFGGKKLLPVGRLREPLKGLYRADEFIITKSDLVNKERIISIENELKKYNKKILKAIHSPSRLYSLNNKEYLLEEIKDKKIIIFSGLANPENFEKTIIFFNPKLIIRKDYEDHHEFIETDIEDLMELYKKENADYLICTEKDFVKIDKMVKYRDEFLVLKIEFIILEE